MEKFSDTSCFDLPSAVCVSVGDGRHDDGDDGPDDGGHAVEVVHAARVMQLQLLLQERLQNIQRVN